MINKFWTDVSLENYNNWYPLTGKITETPQQYIKTWPNVNDWFKTFAIRAQNDINAYLGFILSKFPFDSFKDELIKETLRDMVYVMVEHWVFNRTPIEFNVDATIQFNNGSQFSASSIPTINIWDLAPSRMKIWARLTELKQVFLSYSEDELDVEKIDLKVFYTRNQVDELMKEQKEFTLSKQMKLYDDLVDDNVNEIYRGRVTNFINKGYVATEYDPKTETMILDWPDEIGTLPPEALQNNPQIGDFTHAPTADFSAKQQKRITTNENEITKLNNELTKTNESVDDIKNNWFNIETSPLWKKTSPFIPSNEFNKIYLAIWGYIYQPPSTPTDNYIYSDKKTIFNLGGDVNRTTQKSIKLDELIVNDNVKIQLLFTKEWNDITVTSNDVNYQTVSPILYQYIGKGTPAEFIAAESTGHDYYTKQETNELLDKKQSIDDNNLQTAVKQIVPAINENKVNINKKQDKLNLVIEDNTYKQLKYTQLGSGLFSADLDIPPTKFIKSWINKSIVNGYYWKSVPVTGIKTRTMAVTGGLKDGATYRIGFSWSDTGSNDASIIYEEYTHKNHTSNRIRRTLDSILGSQVNVLQLSNAGNSGFIISDAYGKSDNHGMLLSLDILTKLQENANNYDIVSDTLQINKPNNIDIEKPLHITSSTLNVKELSENTFDIELKDNPTPSIPQWKDVGTSDRETINYELKTNTQYRIFYDVEVKRGHSLIGKYPCIISDFYWMYTDGSAFNDLSIYVPYMNNGNIKNLTINVAHKLISWKRNSNCGNFWKLQELQE